MRILTLFLCAMLPGAAISQTLDSMQAATNLGNILASEKPCELTFDQAAVQTWIDENTDPADMGFANMLSMMTDGAAFGLKGQSDSERSAHCHAVARTAKHFGFIQ